MEATLFQSILMAAGAIFLCLFLLTILVVGGFAWLIYIDSKKPVETDLINPKPGKRSKFHAKMMEHALRHEQKGAPS